MQHFFDWRMMSFQTFPGWMIVVANLVNGLVGAIYLVFIVRVAMVHMWGRGCVYALHTLGLYILFNETHMHLFVTQVERAKKCLDFAATAYIIHFIIVLVFSGFPSNFEWYVCSMVLLVVCGTSLAPVSHVLLLFIVRPTTMYRWVINVIALAAMAMLGEWLCLQCELREIPIGMWC